MDKFKNKVLSQEILSSIHETTRKLNFLVKGFWKEDRKVYLSTKDLHEQIKSIYETTRYSVIAGHELSVTRGIGILDMVRTKAAQIIEIQRRRGKPEHNDKIVGELEELIEKAEAILVTINMIEHPNSIYSFGDGRLYGI